MFCLRRAQVVVWADRINGALLRRQRASRGGDGPIRLRERIVTMAMTTTPDHDIEFETSGRRRKITKFALAGVAVLGVGAALTSAAWSDNVFFGGTSSAGDFELEGYDPTTGSWLPADTAGARIVLPAGILDEVGPGISDSYELRVRNNGDLPIQLETPVVTSQTGALFSGAEPAEITFGTYSDDVLENNGDEATINVIVTGLTTWTGTEYQGASGNMIVQIQGSSVTP
jgi:hypothetical protein